MNIPGLAHGIRVPPRGTIWQYGSYRDPPPHRAVGSPVLATLQLSLPLTALRSGSTSESVGTRAGTIDVSMLQRGARLGPVADM